MKKMFISNGNNMVVDTETNEITNLDSCREAISRIYMLDEDIDIIVKKNNGECITLKGSTGDLLIIFYEGLFDNPAVLINSKEWRDNIEGYNRKIQKEKEEWAAKKAGNSELVGETPCCDCCESSK